MIQWEKVIEMAKPFVENAEQWDIRCARTLIDRCPDGTFPAWMKKRLYADLTDKGWVLTNKINH